MTFYFTMCNETLIQDSLLDRGKMHVVAYFMQNKYSLKNSTLNQGFFNKIIRKRRKNIDLTKMYFLILDTKNKPQHCSEGGCIKVPLYIFCSIQWTLKELTSSVRLTPKCCLATSNLYNLVLQIWVISMGRDTSTLFRSIKRCNSNRLTGGYCLRSLKKGWFGFYIRITITK